MVRTHQDRLVGKADKMVLQATIKVRTLGRGSEVLLAHQPLGHRSDKLRQIQPRGTIPAEEQHTMPAIALHHHLPQLAVFHLGNRIVAHLLLHRGLQMGTREVVMELVLATETQRRGSRLSMVSSIKTFHRHHHHPPIFLHRLQASCRTFTTAYLQVFDVQTDQSLYTDSGKPLFDRSLNSTLDSMFLKY